jgi:hypothetical protein
MRSPKDILNSFVKVGYGGTVKAPHNRKSETGTLATTIVCGEPEPGRVPRDLKIHDRQGRWPWSMN